MPGYELVGEEEQREVNDVFAKGGVLFRHGFDAIRNGCYKVKEFEKAFAQKMNIPYGLAVTSGSSALRVALASLDIKEGDQIITQSFTFVATVEAIIESRAIPICTEVDDTLNMDPKDLEKKINHKTKAVIVVHMLGVPARLSEIKALCDKHKIPLIEDTAWGCGGKFKDKALGTWGDIGTFSFDFAKVMTTGEGGMVVFKKKEHYEKAAAWHDHGHQNNPTVPRWEDTRAGSGFNFRMMELQAAVGLAQLKKLDYIITEQRKNRDAIWNVIKNITGIVPRKIQDGSYDTADALVFFVANKDLAKRCRTMLLENGISTKILPEAITWHFAGTWTHMPELVNACGGNIANAFPQTQGLLERSVSLPISVKMLADIPTRVESALKKALNV